MSIRLIIFLCFTAYIVYLSFKKDPLYLVLLLVFIYFTYPQKYIWGIEQFRIIFVLTAILIIATIFSDGKLNILGDIYSILLICLSLSVLVSAILAQVNDKIALEYSFQFFKLVVFWILLKNILTDLEKIEIFYWTCLISLTFLAAWGIQQYTLGNIRLENFGGGQIVGSNQLASALVWGVPIAYFTIFSEGKRKKKLFALLCLVILLGGIICTESRQAFLAVLLYISYFFMVSKRKVLLSIVFTLCILISVVIAPRNYWERMETIQNYEQDASAVGRLEVWKAAISVWQEHPFVGVGGRNFFLLSSGYTDSGRSRVTHNTFFQALSEEGLIGLGLFLSLVGITIIRLGKIIKMVENSIEKKRVLFCASIARASLIGVCICAIFQNKLEHEFVYWPCAVAASLENIVYGKIKSDEEEKKVRERLT